MQTLTRTEKRQTFSTEVPFSGFYCSLHEQAIDYAEDLLISNDSGDPFRPSLSELLCREINYGELEERYSRDYVVYMAHHTGLPSLTFEELVSPREYNFQTDRIFATIGRADLAKVLWQVRGEPLRASIRELFTSRSGFISFYPNDIKDWPPVDQWDHNHIYAALAAYVAQFEADSGQSLEDQYLEDLCGDLENWIYEAAGGVESRAVRIADYLRRRQERR